MRGVSKLRADAAMDPSEWGSYSSRKVSRKALARQQQQQQQQEEEEEGIGRGRGRRRGG